MRRFWEGQRLEPAGEVVNVYERTRPGRWVLVDSFDCRVRVRRMVCRPKAARP